MCWHWEVFGVESWSKLKSKQAPGRSSELMDWLFEPGSHRAVGRYWLSTAGEDFSFRAMSSARTSGTGMPPWC